MILPILISVSLAPGSYFFSAFAAVAVIAAAAATTAIAIRRRFPAGIGLSPGVLIFLGASQVGRAHASIGLFRLSKRHQFWLIMAAPFVRVACAPSNNNAGDGATWGGSVGAPRWTLSNREQGSDEIEDSVVGQEQRADD